MLERKRIIGDRIGELDQMLSRREEVAVELDALKAVLGDFPRLWEHGTLDERKEMVRLLVEKLTISRDSVTMKIKFMPEETVVFVTLRIDCP